MGVLRKNGRNLPAGKQELNKALDVLGQAVQLKSRGKERLESG